MKENALRAGLDSFNLGEYIEAVRANGRARLDPEVRAQAAELYEDIVPAKDSLYISEDLARTIRLAERVLEPEWMFVQDPIPRYPNYTNWRALNWVLGTYRHMSDVQLSRSCLSGIRILAADWLDFELRTYAGLERFSLDSVPTEQLPERLSRIHAIAEAANPLEPIASTNSIQPPARWRDYVFDSTRTLTLRFLTALPQTTQHDEITFLRTIHIGEACFWAQLGSVMHAIEWLKQGNFSAGETCLRNAARFAGFSKLVFKAMKTMPDEHFMLGFREATGNASAIQSMTYQLLQIFTLGLDPQKVDALARIPEHRPLLLYGNPKFVSLKAKLIELDEKGTLPESLRNAAYDLDKKMYAWRGEHLGIAKRYLADLQPGTGGTAGVLYLENHFRHRIFADPDFVPVTNVDLGSLRSVRARPVFSNQN